MMSCLEDDLAEKDLFEDEWEEWDEFGIDFDSDEDVSLEGPEGQFSCACNHGDTPCIHDTGNDLEPHHACGCRDNPVG
jgi:hypothetical protein